MTESAHLPLACALCLHARERAEDAVTVMDGVAVCGDHTGYVQSPEFTRALIKVKFEERAQS